MPKKNTNEIVALYKKAINETKGNRNSGWGAEDSEKIALQLIKVQTDAEGKDVKNTGGAHGSHNRGHADRSQAVVQFIKTELKAGGIELDDVSEGFLLDLFDIPKFRTQLIGAELIKPGGKGKTKKQSLKELFA